MCFKDSRGIGNGTKAVKEHGFSHHLAMAFGDISKELAILCDCYGIEYITLD